MDFMQIIFQHNWYQYLLDHDLLANIRQIFLYQVMNLIKFPASTPSPEQNLQSHIFSQEIDNSQRKKSYGNLNIQNWNYVQGILKKLPVAGSEMQSSS